MCKYVRLSFVISFLILFSIVSTNHYVYSQKRTFKKIVLADKATEPYFAIQILALKDAPKDASFFENIESAREFSCADGYKRYVVGRYATQAEAMADLQRIRSKGEKYQKSYVVNTANYILSKSDFGDDNQSNEVVGERTTKKIIPVQKPTDPPFAIQILALKNAPQDPDFFENVELAREFSCADGFKRYVVGQYDSYQNASAELMQVRSLSEKYKTAFVVNTTNFVIQASAFDDETANVSSASTQNLDIQSLRTSKRILPVDKLPANSYTVQVLALKEVPRDASFFEKLDVVNEVSCKDGFKRYIVGQYANPDLAKSACERIRKLGPKYQNAFIINTDKLQIDANAFVSEYKNNDEVVDNSATQKEITNYSDKNKLAQANTPYNNEQYPTTSNRATQKIDAPQKIVTASGETAIKTDSKVLIESKRKFESENNANQTNKDEYIVQVPDKKDTKQQLTTNRDELPSTRTSKKIIPVDKAEKPFYTIQILALKETPSDFNYFDNVESAREFSCTDGYKRYVVGQYESYQEAVSDLPRVKALSPKYQNAFVANTKNYDISLDDFRTDYDASNEQQAEATTDLSAEDDANPKKSNLNAIEKASEKVVRTYDPTKTYTIQLTASRYPFYVSELKEFDEVFEFYMPDKVYRYTVGKYSSKEIDAELNKVISLGYTEAFPVDFNKYLPFKIE